MSDRVQTVRSYMTPNPHTVEAEQSLAHAQATLSEHNIRHLPVLRAGQLVGVIRQAELTLVERIHDFNPGLLPAEAVMCSDTYVVSPDTPIVEVARDMAFHKYSSAVVLEGAKVLGILTPVDVCRAFAELVAAS